MQQTLIFFSLTSSNKLELKPTTPCFAAESKHKIYVNQNLVHAEKPFIPIRPTRLEMFIITPLSFFSISGTARFVKIRREERSVLIVWIHSSSVESLVQITPAQLMSVC